MTSALNHRYPSVQGEFENELDSELELEDELEEEFEDELEDEDEDELEFESEAFLGSTARGLGELLGAAAEAEGEQEDEGEFEFEFEAEAELEDESEYESEEEAFINPVQRIYRDAELMAHLSRQAAVAESEEEAEAFVGAMVPLVARLIPRAASLVARNAPALIRGVTAIARQLRDQPATRRLVQALPVVLQRTVQSLADQAAAGRPITAAVAARTVARTTGRVLRTAGSRRSALHAVNVFERRYRQRARRADAARQAAAARRRSTSKTGGPATHRQQPRRSGAANRAASRARRAR